MNLDSYKHFTPKDLYGEGESCEIDIPPRSTYWVPSLISKKAKKLSDEKLYIISKISEATQMQSEWPAARLNAETLQKIIGTDYKRHLNELEDMGLIELYSDYVVGKMSRSWTFTFDVEELVMIDADKNSRVVQNERRWKANSNPFYSTKAGKKQQETLDKIEIKGFEARVWVRNNDNLSEEQKESYRNSIRRVEEENLQMHVTQINGRIYSQITNLPSDLLQFLNLDGDPLVEVDITNSQPYFLSRGSESKKFRRLAEKGELYEELQEGGVSREESKEACFAAMYSRVGDCEDEKEVFENSFPEVMKEIQSFKEEYGYKSVPNTATRHEAHMMFKIFQRLANDDIDYISRYDSVIVKQSQLNSVLKHFKSILPNSTTHTNLLTNPYVVRDNEQKEDKKEIYSFEVNESKNSRQMRPGVVERIRSDPYKRLMKVENE